MVGLVQPKEPIYPPLIMENQMEKKMENEMETAIIGLCRGLYYRDYSLNS